MRKAAPLLTAVFIVFWLVTAASAGPPPLPELGADFYSRDGGPGSRGGLYPNGENIPPPWYLGELETKAEEKANECPLVLLLLGMSAMQNMADGFGNGGGFGYATNPCLVVINGAIGSKQQQWQDPNHTVWDRGTQMLAAAGYTAADVGIVFYHNAIGGLSGDFPASAYVLKDSLQITMDIIPTKYPAVDIIYLTSRYHANCAPAGSKSPEPYAYESGFSVKWLIDDRINGLPEKPLLAWFTYLWDESWPCSHYISDGIHLSNTGKAAAGQVWADFMATSSYIAPWYLAGPAPTATPTAEPTETAVLTPTPTATPAGGTATVTPSVTATPFPPTATPDNPTMTPTTRGGGCGRSCQTATAEAGG